MKTATVDQLMAELLKEIHIDEAGLAQHVAVIRKYIPDWHGKIANWDDARELATQLEVALNIDRDICSEQDVPNDLITAVAWVEVRIAALDLVAKAHRLFGDRDLFQAAAKVWKGYMAGINARAKGGKATAKWTPELAKLAGEFYADFKRPGLTNEAAYRRTAAKLKAECGVSVSVSTLKRWVGKQANAKR